MKAFGVCVVVLGLLAGLVFGQKEAQKVKEDVVIVVEGNKAPKVKVGDLLRFKGSGASGRTEISATAADGAKIMATRTVERFVNGQRLIGAYEKEFDVKAEKKGKATVTITIKDTIDNKTETKKYEFEIE